jgi:MYXO-CTERM domain-containing protein
MKAALSRLAWVGVVALSLIGSSSAQADIVRLSYDEAGVDPAETFEEDCLGATPADDCDTRAALIKADLVTVLARLENDSDPKTLPIFQAALELDSPVVQAMATRYLARSGEEPSDFVSKVKTFFFGPDAPLGVSSADALSSLGDSSEQQLADLYGEQRSASDYAARALADGSEGTGDDALAVACTRDARLDLMPSFTAEEQFAPAQRLLMYDRFIYDTFAPTEDYPVTSFLTDASVDEVSDFFTQLFGDPYSSLAESEVKIQELSDELEAAQTAAMTGDKDAIIRLGQLITEFTDAQQMLTVGSSLQLPILHAENDLIWLDGTIDDVSQKPVRAVTVGEDPLLGKTIIRYINAPAGDQSETPGNGNGSGGQPASPSGDAGMSAAEGGAASRSTTKADDGCGCSVPGTPAPTTPLAPLAVLALLARRRLRRA